MLNLLLVDVIGGAKHYNKHHNQALHRTAYGPTRASLHLRQPVSLALDAGARLDCTVYVQWRGDSDKKNKACMINIFVVALAVGCISTASCLPTMAQESPVIPQQRLVTVTGDAEVKVVPDEVLLTLGLETSNLDLAKAKSLNNERVKGVMAIAKEFKIDPKYVQVDFISIDPNYWRSKNAFTVRRNMVITVKDTSKFEAILTRMVQNNRANYVHGIQFRTSELRKYRDQARNMAVKAAQEKATALAEALGAKIGKPYAIREEGSNWWSWYSPYWGSGGYGGGYAQNVSMNAQVSLNNNYGGGSQNSTFAPGQIAVNARITVSFELQ